jgi:hypothetical protein
MAVASDAVVLPRPPTDDETRMMAKIRIRGFTASEAEEAVYRHYLRGGFILPSVFTQRWWEEEPQSKA